MDIQSLLNFSESFSSEDDNLSEQKQFLKEHSDVFMGKQIQNPKKEKKIKKEGIKKGRPRKETYENEDNIFQVDDIDPVMDIKEIFLKYLFEIGLIKGLVFKEKVRKRLQKEQKKRKENKIQWGKRHSWNIQEEKEKIRNKIQPFKKRYNEEEMKIITEKFLDISDMFSMEATNDVYEFLVMVMEFYGKAETEYVVKKLYNSCIFLTGRFTNLKIHYEIEIIDKGQIYQKFRELFINVTNKIGKEVFPFLSIDC